ncbi:hypothetical protein NQ314_012847 [Rhamnusium bicolor]|uniref:NF-kappa-B essential modulator NEMO CC2-LZ domain-containing protein n=1 Tax=Rhamnusium bicolor TaxID=1586634 RepID=A0AAV8X8Z4_9CUCU|nr:hypothetical protein NQ314_012847 [Rhamnusium bicolor]
MSMKSQYERILTWQEDVQKVHQSYKQKVTEAKESIERLKQENYNLTRDLEKLKETNNVQDLELTTLKNALKAKERQSNEKLSKSSDDNIKEFQLDISNKKSERTGAKMELLKVKSLDEEKQKSLNEVIESLRSQLCFKTHQQTMLPSPEEVTNIRQQLANTQVMLTQSEHSRATAYNQVSALNNELLNLKKLLSQSQKDEIYALQTQLDVYKTDFEAERSAKDTIRAENEKLSTDIQNLHRRNQQLQEELDLIRERDYVVYPMQRRDRESTSSSTSNEHSMKCPKCNFGFKTLQTLENHVYRCIELDDNLP